MTLTTVDRVHFAVNAVLHHERLDEELSEDVEAAAEVFALDVKVEDRLRGNITGHWANEHCKLDIRKYALSQRTVN